MRCPCDFSRFFTLSVCILMTWVAARAVNLPEIAATPRQVALDLTIYDGVLGPGWQDYSWATHKLGDKSFVFQTHPSLQFTPDSWKGLYLHHAAFNTEGFTALSLWLNGGQAGGQKIAVCVVDASGKFGVKVDLAKNIIGGRIPPNKWTLAIIPLSRMNAQNKLITGVSFQDSSGAAQFPIYLCDIRLVGRKPRAPAPYTVDVDTARDAKTISPLIYGMASAPAVYLKDLRLGLNRWGGNPSTRYNWEKGNCWSAAGDWEFRNGNYGAVSAEARKPSGVADQFVEGNRAAGVASLLTIPTIGWVAKDDNNESRSLNVPAIGGAPVSPGSEAIVGYDPAQNQQRTSIRSVARKGKPFVDPPDLTDGVVYQDEWVHHLVSKFGQAGKGGVQFYAMDNEADIWDTTHRDVHPVAMSYDQMLSMFMVYSRAVKAVDANAQITGPVSWGWTGYYHSPRDRNRWNERPDRKAHGDIPFIPWFLSAVQKRDKLAGSRSLDVLDFHYYPQANGVYTGQTDPQIQALRLRSVRALWDPTYTDESWIAEPVMLLPRMKDWVARNYPGTRLGLTEWNFGADSTMNGGLAVADCLGVFGREGLYLANYWTAPTVGSPGYFAFRIFRNADGKGRGFGDKSVRAISNVPDDISSYAAVDSTTGEPTVLLINKQPDRDAIITLHIRHSKPVSMAGLYRYDASDITSIQHLRDIIITQGTLRLKLPAYSITLLRMR